MAFAIKINKEKKIIDNNTPPKYGRVTLGSYTLSSGSKTYNIKTSYPSLYANLTNTNFFLSITGIATATTGAYTYAQTGSSSVTTTYSITQYPSLSYNASTGILTCTYGRGSVECKNNNTAVDNKVSAFTVAVYMAYAYD